MCKITVVDACMGRGKSTAAINYMNEHRGRKRFLYVTPYLNEVDRICEKCGFEQTDGTDMTKSADLKNRLRRGASVSATHSLFHRMDDETLSIVREKRYSVVIDESVQVIQRTGITREDLRLMKNLFLTENDTGELRWNTSDYDGVFNEYREMANHGFLFHLDAAILSIMDPEKLRAFDEVYMLTYLFDGQYLKAYLDYYGFEYKVVGVKHTEHGIFFSDEPDMPPPVDYSDLIHIVDDRKMNTPGDGKTALSKAWFNARGYDDPEMKKLRNSMKRFFQSFPDGDPATRLWTSFKSHRDKLVDKHTGRFKRNFLQISARATNEYRGRRDVAYMANRFVDPNLSKFFYKRGVRVNEELYALSEMLQWVWRSAIRDGKPINLYIPSSRMRTLMIDWMKKINRGG